MAKRTFPLDRVYGLLEPGPVVLLTTRHKERNNVMVQSWHTMLEFEPPLIGCVVSNRGFSFTALCATRECVLAIPPVTMLDSVVDCGNHSGREIDKFAQFGLQTQSGQDVAAPLIRGCLANLECRVVDTRLVRDYGFFVLEVVHAWHDPDIQDRRTLHHLGRGHFMQAGEIIKTRSRAR